METIECKHAAQWEATLSRYVFPRLGAQGVHTLTTAGILAVLVPIWHEKAETARRVRQRIGAVMPLGPLDRAPDRALR